MSTGETPLQKHLVVLCMYVNVNKVNSLQYCFVILSNPNVYAFVLRARMKYPNHCKAYLACPLLVPSRVPFLCHQGRYSRLMLLSTTIVRQGLVP